MEKIILFTFVVLAAVLMVNGQTPTNASNTMPSTPAATTTGNNSIVSTPAGNASAETTTTTSGGKETTPKAAVAAIQPLAIFVLACAFLGLMH